MIDLVFKGKVSISSDNQEKFMKEFNDLLNNNKVQFIGTVQAVEFEDAEIVND